MVKIEQVPLRSPGGLGGLWGRLRGLVAAAFLFSTLIAINVLQTLSLAILPFSRAAFRRFNRLCADQWWGLCVVCSRTFYGAHLVLSGDELPDRENAILVANHQQMPDIVALFFLARSKHRLGDLKWFVKEPLKYVPGVGWGMLFLDCLFVKRNWDSDQGLIRKVFRKFNEDHIPIWLVSFSEGTRFTPAKRARSWAYARENGLPSFEHLLLPRTKGFAASVIGLRQHVTAVYDITIAYEKGIPNLWQFTCGWVDRISMHVKRYPIADLPSDPEALSRWLRERFEEKDRLLGEFFATGSFSARSAIAKLEQSETAPAAAVFRAEPRPEPILES
jgi:1-acyl-sn-glycerol-3-phosphate acyltransferase